jgi:small subunit ribosomal protein S11
MLVKKQQNTFESLQTLKIAQPHKFCLIHINKTKNNTHCVISPMFGKQKTLWSISGGHIIKGSLNSRRKTRYVQRMVFKATIEKIFGLGMQYLVIHCRGAIPSKRQILKTFSDYFTIVLIKDLTNIPHNGSKPPNKRRV